VAHTKETPRYRYGAGRVIGFGAKSFYVEELPATVAIGVIRSLHYSGTHVNNSRVHLGVYAGSPRRWLVGVLQLGPMLNPGCQEKVVAGTGRREYLELNRMWLSAEMPRNSESRAISHAIKYIRAAHPEVKWIQSFADERCGRLGAVYQAANFEYLGFHWSRFFWLDGEWFHEIKMTNTAQPGVRGALLQANAHRAETYRFRQFRYIFFLDRRSRRGLGFTPKPYPKPADFADEPSRAACAST